MFRIIPHIVKRKVGRGLYFPLKYSDLESYILEKGDKDIHFDVYFYANHSYWLSKAYKLWREEKFMLADVSYSPKDKYRYWSCWDPREDSLVVRCRVQALPQQLAANLGLTHSVLHNSITNTFIGLEKGGLFNRRWQVTVRLDLRDRLLECASFVWKGVKPITVTYHIVELGREKDAKA